MEPISAKLVLCARRRSQPLDAPSHLNLINALWANVIYSFFKQGSWGSERLNNSLKGTQLLSGKGKNNTWRCSTLGWCACSRWCQQELSSLTFIIHTNLYSSSTCGFHSRDPPAGKLRWICPGVRLGKERGREGSRTCSNSWTEGKRSGRQLGDLPDKALKAIGKSRPV